MALRMFCLALQKRFREEHTHYINKYTYNNRRMRGFFKIKNLNVQTIFKSKQQTISYYNCNPFQEHHKTFIFSMFVDVFGEKELVHRHNSGKDVRCSDAIRLFTSSIKCARSH